MFDNDQSLHFPFLNLSQEPKNLALRQLFLITLIANLPVQSLEISRAHTHVICRVLPSPPYIFKVHYLIFINTFNILINASNGHVFCLYNVVGSQEYVEVLICHAI